MASQFLLEQQKGNSAFTESLYRRRPKICTLHRGPTSLSLSEQKDDFLLARAGRLPAVSSLVPQGSLGSLTLLTGIDNIFIAFSLRYVCTP